MIASIACVVAVSLAVLSGTNDSVAQIARSDFGIEALVKVVYSEVENVIIRLADAIETNPGDVEDRMILESYRKNISSPGPCTVCLGSLESAVGSYAESLLSGKIKAADSALEKAKEEIKKIKEYHERIATKAGYDSVKAQRMASYSTWIDYQTINPLVGGLEGRRPTAAEYARLRARLTGEKARIFDRGIDAWKQGSLALFGRPGPITQEDAGTR